VECLVKEISWCQLHVSENPEPSDQTEPSGCTRSILLRAGHTLICTQRARRGSINDVSLQHTILI
jgi:hypothetical protein